MNSKFLMVPVIALVITGAGCGESSDYVSDTATAPVVSTDSQVEISATAPVESAPVAVVTDDSWKPYTNKSLGFSFKTPTKGRNVPQWDVKILPANDAKIVDGCWEIEKGAEKKQVTVDGQTFCHTGNMVSKDGVVTLVDKYVTKVGKSYVAVGFSKTAYSISDKKCVEKTGAEFTSVKDACEPIVSSDYQTMLDGIVGTFKVGEDKK